MNGPTKKQNFSERAERLEKLSVVAALVVVAGLIIESGPDLARAIAKGVLPSREVQGNVLVTLAVAAEAILGWRALTAARKAEIDAEERIAAAERASAEANERAASAERAAAEANLARVQIEREIASMRSVRRLTNE